MPKVETVLTDEDLKIPLASPYGQISSGNRIQAFQIRKVAKLPSQSFDFNDSLASIVGEVPFDDLDSEVSQVFQRDAGSASVRWSENCDLYPQSRAKSATSPEVQLLRPMSADVREFLDQYRSQSSDQIAMVPVHKLVSYMEEHNIGKGKVEQGQGNSRTPLEAPLNLPPIERTVITPQSPARRPTTRGSLPQIAENKEMKDVKR